MITITVRKGGKHKLAKKLFKLSSRIKNIFGFRLIISEDNVGNFIFSPSSKIEFSRYVTYFVKEEGTIDWLKNNIKNGDVFFDIGANIGLYSLYAARMGSNVKVMSFEPHKLNFTVLLDNIMQNGLGEQISPISIPLNDSEGVIKFNYNSLDKGSSASQLGHNDTYDGAKFAPQLQEITYAVKLDDLIEQKAVPLPNLIKIDVDGNEILILKGMRNLLSSPQRPRQVQVEVNPGQKATVTDFMAECGYKIQQIHFSQIGKRSLDKGVSEDLIPHNVIYQTA